jgi:glycine betaine/proline transport system substrate-binding protein
VNRRNMIITAVVVVILIVGIVVNNVSGSDKRVVVLGDKSWDSIQVHNRIVAFIIENGFEGYETDFIPGDTVPIVQGVMNGDIDIDMESWHSNFVDIYEKGVESGKLIDLGKNLPDAPQGWYVPRYLVEGDDALAPDLKSVEDLPKYASLFPDPEDSSKGIIYGGAAGWGQLPISQEIFDRNNLKEYFNFMVPGSGTALQAPLVAAYEKKNHGLVTIGNQV